MQQILFFTFLVFVMSYRQLIPEGTYEFRKNN